MSALNDLRRRKPAVDESCGRWAALIEDDMVGIDGDIERLIEIYRAELGCTREKASAALVRKLSSLGLGRSALRLEKVC